MTSISFHGKVIRSFIQNLTGGSINAAASILSGYFFALILGPTIYGVWQTARVFTSYGTFTSLGIPFVIRRDFIRLRSEGRIEEATRMAQVGMTYSFVVNPIIALIFIAIAVFSGSELAFRLSLLVVGLFYITDLFSGIGDIMHKGFNDYRTLAKGAMINGVGTLLIVPMVYIWGYYALLAGYLMLSIIKSYFFYQRTLVPYKWLVDIPLLKKMVFTAFPIFLVTITSTLFASIDRLLIAGMLDFENVGLYSLSTFIAQPITLLVSSFSIVLFTHLNERYGKSKEAHVLNKHVFIPQMFFSRLLPPLIGIGVVMLPVLTAMFLPKYTEGINAAQINIFSVLFIKLAGFSSNGLFVLDKQKFIALSFFLAGMIKTLGSYFALKAGYGIVAVALSTLIAYFFYNALMQYFVNRFLKNSMLDFARFLFKSLLAPLVIIIFCYFYLSFNVAVYEWFGVTNLYAQMLFGTAIITIVGAPFLYETYKSMNGIRKKS